MTATPPASAKRRFRWPRWLLRAGAGVLVLLLIAAGALAGWRWYRHGQLMSRANDAVAEMDRTHTGWRWDDIQAARETVPDEENAALRAEEASQLLPEDWEKKECWKAFEDLEPQQPLDKDQLSSIIKEMDVVAPALLKARTLADMPRGRFALHTQPGRDGDYRPLQRLNNVRFLLFADVMLRARTGELKTACRSCRAEVNAGRAVGDEPTPIAQLVRIACVAIACSCMEQALAGGEPPLDELEECQSLLEKEEAFPGFLTAVRGEGAIQHAVSEAFEKGALTLGDFDKLGGGEGKPPATLTEYWQSYQIYDMIPDQHPQVFTLMNPMEEIAQLPAHERWTRLQGAQSPDRLYHGMPSLPALSIPAMVKVGEAFTRRDAALRCMIATLAVERYRRRHGDWPLSLNALTPDLMAAVPIDPFDGQPLRYKHLADRVIIYSTGPDGVDDGGVLDHDKWLKPGGDLGFRLWNPDQRGRPGD